MSEDLLEEIRHKERGDLADSKKVGRRALMDKLQIRRRQEDVLFVLSTTQGRRFYWELMKRCGIFETSMTGNNTTFFNEGMRNIGLMLLNDLNELAPQAYLKMMEESKYEEAQKA